MIYTIAVFEVPFLDALFCLKTERRERLVVGIETY